MDYVEYSYMREVADKEFPGWSWTIEKTEVLGSAAYVVHGRLKWFDEGIWRQGDMCAAHRIQKKRGVDEFVDIGNDVKAANTDCIKKAFNQYMNIADDVYRNQVEDLMLTGEKILCRFCLTIWFSAVGPVPIIATFIVNENTTTYLTPYDCYWTGPPNPFSPVRNNEYGYMEQNPINTENSIGLGTATARTDEQCYSKINKIRIFFI